MEATISATGVPFYIPAIAANGTVASSFKVNGWVPTSAGAPTATRRTFYTDAELTTPASNPATLGASGRVVYVNPSLAIVFTITDAAGAVTYDTVFLPAETSSDGGATVITAPEYNAAADGVTDDSPVWQAMLDDAEEGYVIDGLGKRYLINTTLTALKSAGFPNNVTIRNAIFIAGVATDLDVLRVYGDGTALTGLSASTSATITVTIAAPGVVTWNSHGLVEGTPVRFTTTGALPTGITASTTYYVKYLTANTFHLAATVGGTAITTSGSQSGTHTGTRGLIAGTTSITATGAVAADAGKFIWLASTDKTAPGKADTYLTGELIRIRSVSGTTITLEHGLRSHYLASITATLVNQVEGIRLENIAFEGVSTRSQGGVHFYRAYECHAETRGENIGYATQFWDQCASCTFEHKGSNPDINADNGTDYGVVAANGCDIIEGKVIGRHYRHLFASGGTQGQDYNLKVVVIGSDMKDSAVDAHPNVMGMDAEIAVTGPRNGGTFSSQPVGLTWQGSGFLKARISANGFASSVCLLQPHLQTINDQIDVEVQAVNPTSAATRIIEGDLYKAGGSIRSLNIHAHGPSLTAAASRAVSISTANCTAGVSIKYVEIDGVFEGTEYGALLNVVSGTTAQFAKLQGFAAQPTTANYGFAVFGFVTDVLFQGCETEGVASAFGIRADSNVGHARAIGCRATGVGGAGITNQAEVGIDSSTGGTYT